MKDKKTIQGWTNFFLGTQLLGHNSTCVPDRARKKTGAQNQCAHPRHN